MRSNSRAFLREYSASILGMAQAAPNHYVQTGFIETESALIDANTCSMLDHEPMNTITDDEVKDEINSSRQDYSQKSGESREEDIIEMYKAAEKYHENVKS